MSYKPRMTEEQKKKDKKVKISEMMVIFMVPTEYKSAKNVMKANKEYVEAQRGKKIAERQKMEHVNRMIAKRRLLNKKRKGVRK